MWLRDQREDGTQRSTHGDAEHVRIGQRIAQQRLKTGSRDGERRANNDAEKDARQTDILDDQDIITGKIGALAQKNVPEIPAEGVKRNGDSAKLHGDDHHDEQDQHQDRTLQEEAPKRQWAHARPPGVVMRS